MTASAPRWSSYAGSRPRRRSSATAKAGGIPINAAVYRDPIADERKYRWMKPLAESLPHAVNIYQFPEASEVIAILELGLNRAVAGEITPVAALNGMADEVHGVMSEVRLQYRQAAATALSDRWHPAFRHPREPRGLNCVRVRAHGRAPGDDVFWRWAELRARLVADAGAQPAAAGEPGPRPASTMSLGPRDGRCGVLWVWLTMPVSLATHCSWPASRTR